MEEPAKIVGSRREASSGGILLPSQVPSILEELPKCLWQSWEKMLLSRLGMGFLRSTGISNFFPGVVKKMIVSPARNTDLSFWIGPRSTKWYSLNAFQIKNTGFSAFHLESEEKKMPTVAGRQARRFPRCSVVVVVVLVFDPSNLSVYLQA
jgi:hypothetical protein